MSDTILKVIPATPSLVPPEVVREKAKTYLSKWVSPSSKVESIVRPRIQFIDCGANFEMVRCPHLDCGQKINLDWWQGEMDRADKNEFRELSIKLPCCGLMNSLNTIVYIGDCGFARFSLEIVNPGIVNLMPEVKRRLADYFETPVKEISSRI